MLFTYLPEAFVQSDMQVWIKAQGQPIPGANGVKGLAQGTNGNMTMLAGGFELATTQIEQIVSLHCYLKTKLKAKSWICNLALCVT